MEFTQCFYRSVQFPFLTVTSCLQFTFLKAKIGVVQLNSSPTSQLHAVKWIDFFFSFPVSILANELKLRGKLLFTHIYGCYFKELEGVVDTTFTMSLTHNSYPFLKIGQNPESQCNILVNLYFLFPIPYISNHYWYKFYYNCYNHLCNLNI